MESESVITLYMVDITHKSNTLREATAQAIVKVGGQQTIELVNAKQIPKGDVFEMSRAAGLLGIKKTPDLLPDCHPLPIEFTGVEYEIEGLEIKILMTVKTIYKTGVEVEAMHGASVVALNMYDMLKPVDKNVEINSIKLLKKTGGKSSFNHPREDLTCKVVVCSDSVSNGEKEDKSGKLIEVRMKEYGLTTSIVVIPNEKDSIEEQVHILENDLLIFTGTGVGLKDAIPDMLRPMLDTTLQGVEEEIRRYGQERLPTAMLSKSVAGIKDKKIILAFQGSSAVVDDCMNAIFPHIFHVFHVLKGGDH